MTSAGFFTSDIVTELVRPRVEADLVTVAPEVCAFVASSRVVLPPFDALTASFLLPPVLAGSDRRVRLFGTDDVVLSTFFSSPLPGV